MKETISRSRGSVIPHREVRAMTTAPNAIGAARGRRSIHRGERPGAGLSDREPDVRIVLAETYELLRLGIRTLLSDQPGFRIVAEAGGLSDALDLAHRLRPDLLLLDMALVTADRWDAIRALPAACRRLRMVTLIAPGQRQSVIDALRLGISGILYKDVSAELAIKCVRCVMAGEYWIGRETVGEVMEGWRAVADSNGYHGAQRQHGLTSRELEIVSSIMDGLTNQDIAEELSISIETVKHHLTRIFDKTGVSSRLALSHFAVQNGLAATRSVEQPAQSDVTPDEDGGRFAAAPAARRGQQTSVGLL
jgi:two-component system nitrate/nitrite response regulator NarL